MKWLILAIFILGAHMMLQAGVLRGKSGSLLYGTGHDLAAIQASLSATSSSGSVSEPMEQASRRIELAAGLVPSGFGAVFYQSAVVVLLAIFGFIMEVNRKKTRQLGNSGS
jgi:hypothetical protein